MVTITAMLLYGCVTSHQQATLAHLAEVEMLSRVTYTYIQWHTNAYWSPVICTRNFYVSMYVHVHAYTITGKHCNTYLYLFLLSCCHLIIQGPTPVQYQLRTTGVAKGCQQETLNDTCDLRKPSQQEEGGTRNRQAQTYKTLLPTYASNKYSLGKHIPFSLF